jgi:hypothetical protein
MTTPGAPGTSVNRPARGNLGGARLLRHRGAAQSSVCSSGFCCAGPQNCRAAVCSPPPPTRLCLLKFKDSGHGTATPTARQFFGVAQRKDETLQQHWLRPRYCRSLAPPMLALVPARSRRSRVVPRPGEPETLPFSHRLSGRVATKLAR